LKVIRKAWTEESWDYCGEYYQVPYPYEEGIRPWRVPSGRAPMVRPAKSTTGRRAQDQCRTEALPRPAAAAVPAFLGQREPIRYTAQSGIVPWMLVSYPPDFHRLCRVYQEVAGAAGRNLRLGESVGAFRAVHFGRTEEEAVALFRDTNFAGFYNYFGGFGFWEVVPYARRQREILGRVIAAIRVDRRAAAQVEMRARRDGRPGEGGDRGAAQDRR
jgi:hypothetical protein